ncbi:MAG TPA: hypothetical protein VJY39_12040 [Acidisphaera sp.]|nr:hypothetical protein [Acidisphaera sp.]
MWTSPDWQPLFRYEERMKGAVAALVLTFVLVTVIDAAAAAGAANEQYPWTMQDVQTSAHAAMADASVIGGSDEAPMLLQLANALTHSGALAEGRTALQQAASALRPPEDRLVRGEIIEAVARTGDAESAEALADITEAPAMRAMLLGKLGAGLAQADDPAGAFKAAARIDNIQDEGDTSPAYLGNRKDRAVAEIGLALNARGASDRALQLAHGLADALPKVKLLGQVAQTLCRAGAGDDVEHGRRVAAQAVTAAQHAPVDPDSPHERMFLVEPAAEALAVCDGPPAALSFVEATLSTQRAFWALNAIANDLTTRGEFSLARAVAPPPSPDDAEALLAAAARLSKQGDRDAARLIANQASRAVLQAARDARPKQISRINLTTYWTFGLLNDLGEYDQAIATIQLHDASARRDYYVTTIAVAAGAQDAAAVARLLPLAIDAAKQPETDWGTIRQLSGLTRTLAVAGYRAEALTCFGEFKAQYDELIAAGAMPANFPLLAEMQAVVGHLPDALATADLASPLIVKPSWWAATQPGDGVLIDGTHRRYLQTPLLTDPGATLPPLVTGPKAFALSAIVTALAAVGNLDAALDVEHGLEGEPRDVLWPLRDEALRSISEAQQRAGDLEASLATALRLTRPEVRFKRLLELVSVSPR